MGDPTSHRNSPRRVRRKAPSSHRGAGRGSPGPALCSHGHRCPVGSKVVGTLPRSLRGGCSLLCSESIPLSCGGRGREASWPLSYDRYPPGPCGFQHPVGSLLLDTLLHLTAMAKAAAAGLRSACLDPQQASLGHACPWHLKWLGAQRAPMEGREGCGRLEPLHSAPGPPRPPTPLHSSQGQADPSAARPRPPCTPSRCLHRDPLLACFRTPCSHTLRRTEARSAPLTGLLPGTGGGPALSLCHVFSHVVHSGHVLPPHTFLVRAACMLRSTAGPGGYCHILGFQGAADSLGGPLLTGRCCQGTAGLKMPVRCQREGRQGVRKGSGDHSRTRACLHM